MLGHVRLLAFFSVSLQSGVACRLKPRTNFGNGLTVAFVREASSFSVAWLMMDHLSNSLRDFCSAIAIVNVDGCVFWLNV